MREVAVRLARSTTAAGQRKRTSFEYRVHGEPVSRTALSFVYNLGSISLKRIQKLPEGGAMYPDSHGLAGWQAAQNLYLSDAKQTVLEFIRSHATVYDLPMPGASRGRPEGAPVYLPASNTFISIHADYMKVQGL